MLIGLNRISDLLVIDQLLSIWAANMQWSAMQVEGTVFKDIDKIAIYGMALPILKGHCSKFNKFISNDVLIGEIGTTRLLGMC